MHPTNKEDEFKPELVHRIPSGLSFVNITGGEPFLRKDIEEIIDIALTKTSRLVISTNGYFTSKLAALAEKYGNRIGFRVSIEGLPAANDQLRGISDGFDSGLRSLLTLHDMGIRDIGFGITVSDRNARDMIELWRLAKAMGLEFATAVTHNSYYFHKKDNAFDDPEMIAGEFEKIALELLKSNRPKNWFRAYFNIGLANKVRGGKRPLPCEVGTDVFFMDPFGRIMPCNGSDEPMIMGSLHEQEFEEIWKGERAENVRSQVRACAKDCWMIGSAAPAMKKRKLHPILWIVRNKMRALGRDGATVCLSRL
jgi:MoaA/NifB/PqqE/SkfB family radical SAM enzyme